MSKNCSKTFKDKFKIIREVDKGRAISDVASFYGISTTTIRTWIKQREKIEKCVSNLGLARKRVKKFSYEEVDQALWDWFSKAKTLTLKTKCQQLYEKASELASALGYSSDVINRNWIARFKKRHGVHHLLRQEKSPFHTLETNATGTSTSLHSAYADDADADLSAYPNDLVVNSVNEDPPSYTEAVEAALVIQRYVDSLVDQSDLSQSVTDVVEKIVATRGPRQVTLDRWLTWLK